MWDVKIGVAEDVPHGDEQFNGVLLGTILSYVKDRPKTVAVAYRVPKHDGHVVVSFLPGEGSYTELLNAHQIFRLFHHDCNLLPRETPEHQTHQIQRTTGCVIGNLTYAHRGGKLMGWESEKEDVSKTVEERFFPNGKVELITICGATIGRAIFEPGWQWSTSVQPIEKVTSCEAPHFQFQVAGTLKVVMDDGTELLCKPGEVSLLPSGRDAWVVGNENVVIVDFHGVNYAMRVA
jgi:hypothetical protein